MTVYEKKDIIIISLSIIAGPYFLYNLLVSPLITHLNLDVLRMKVRRIVIVKEHLDDNTEESTDLRHV